MSHAATNWAIRQRGMKPATKIVLWHLADCHNGHTGQCNPRQSVLADLCEMSRSTLNRHLDRLEEMGLIERHVSVDPDTKTQRPTSYSLAFDRPENPVSQNETRAQDVVVPCRKTRHGAVSQNETNPCLKNDESRVSKRDTKNPGIEPGRVVINTRAPARETADQHMPSARERILAAIGVDPVSGMTGNGGTMLGRSSDMLEVDRWQNDLGLGIDEIVEIITEVMARKRDGPPKSFSYFTEPMRRYAGERDKDRLEAISGERDDRRRKETTSKSQDRLSAFVAGARGSS